MILSNKWMDGSKAWFKLLHTVRVQGTSEEAYNCVYEAEDKINADHGRIEQRKILHIISTHILY